MATATKPSDQSTKAKTGARQPKPLPAPNSDFYQLAETLSADELALLKQVRAFMETKVAPIINKYWVEDSFPFELLPAFKELNIGGLGMNGYECRGGGALLFGLIAMEMARVDSSIATFFGVHNGLAMGSIYLVGSEDQKQKWLPPMARMEKIGCFGLTEPLVGSGTGGGLTTTAKREGDTWVLNGQKRWIGNATWCDISIIWAKDVADNQVKGFIVENKTTPGFSVEKIENKIALKVVQNGQITLTDCRVPDANRLQGGSNSFRDTARVLRQTRYLVGWESTGLRDGGLRARAQVRSGAFAVRQADRLVPAHSGPARPDALQHHGLSVPGRTHGAARRDRQADGLPGRALQGVLHQQEPRDGCVGPRASRRQRHCDRLPRGPALRRRRSPLLLRGHLPDATPDSRQGDHRLQRFRVNRRHQAISN